MPARPIVRARRHVLSLGVVLLALLVNGCAIVDFEQRRWILQPGARTWGPGEEAARGMQDVWIDYTSTLPGHRGEPVRLHGLWLPHADPQAPVLLYLHGVRWDVRASAPRMRQMHELGFAVIAVDYRGFGRSTDVLPSEEMFAEDVRAAWDWIGREHPGRARFVFGHSLGGAVAVRLAHEVGDEAGLIVEGGFTSIPDVWASLRVGWIPLEWMITQRFDAASRIATVGSPVLVVHGSDDGMVQPRLGRALYERAQHPKRFELIDGASHYNANLLGTGQYRTALAALFGIGSTRCDDAPSLAAAPAAPAAPQLPALSGPAPVTCRPAAQPVRP